MFTRFFNARTRQWLQALLLFCLGLYFLENMLSGRIYYYINERFGWLSWLATIMFLALGVVGVVDLVRQRRAEQEEHAHEDHDHEHHAHDDHDEHDHHEHHNHDHDHDHEGHSHAGVSWPILFLIALPLILGLVVPSKPLGASAVGTSGVSTTYSAVQGSGTSAQVAMASTDRNVLDWVKAFNGSSNIDEFSGQQADVIGFVYRDIRFKDQPRFMAARFTISCCVAHASAIRVIVASADASQLVEDSWIHVTGKFQVQDFGGQKTPILVADKIEPTTQPEHPYLYP